MHFSMVFFRKIFTWFNLLAMLTRDPSLLQDFINFLAHQFDIKDLGPLSYFLGLQVSHQDGSLHLSQLKYANDLLEKTALVHSKLASTPLVAMTLLSLIDINLLSNPIEYCELVSSLQYLTLTRPDISFVVNTVTQFMSASRTTHLIATK
ncbi:unnamed protein product [Prunus armeniaca]